MNNETTYVERAGSMNAAAMASRLSADAAKCADFKTEMRSAAKFMVSAANVSRELGQSFAEYWLPNEAAAAENYFNSHYRPVLQIEFATFQWIISASRKLQDETRSMEDAYPAIKQLLLGGGLIAEGERAAPQESHDATPVVTVFDRLGKARVALDRTFESADGWDADTRNGVREVVAKFEEALNKWKAKLAQK